MTEYRKSKKLVHRPRLLYIPTIFRKIGRKGPDIHLSVYMYMKLMKSDIPPQLFELL